ncbi:MAG TPA: hypothetical protein VE733_00850 [Streptosporangiaceae bacterium]|nr:hypothetical protein [Streptosporangiaceae bacterium]
MQNAVTGGHLDIGAGSLLGLAALLDANPDLDAGALADEYAARVLRACGLSKAEAAQLASRPLPDLTSFAQPAPAPASEPL